MKNLIHTFGVSIFAMLETFFCAIANGIIFGLGLWPLSICSAYILGTPSIGFLGCFIICTIVTYIKGIPKFLYASDASEKKNSNLAKPIDIKNFKK